MKIIVLLGILLVLLAPIIVGGCGTSAQSDSATQESPTPETLTNAEMTALQQLQQQIDQLTKRVKTLEYQVGGGSLLLRMSLYDRVSAIERQLRGW